MTNANDASGGSPSRPSSQSEAAAARARDAGYSALVVTVDCGAASHDAFAQTRALPLDAIVLDHHRVETNPPVFAHVNPNGPDDQSGLTYICAAGLAFLFLVAVQRHLREMGWFAKAGIDETGGAVDKQSSPAQT